MRKIALLMAVLGVLCAGAASADTTVGGTISTNTTWTLAGSPYIVTSSVTVNANQVAGNVTLTVEPGVVVKFNPGTGLNLGAGNASFTGTLVAQGTVGSPIILTSNSATPVPGQWNGINFVTTTADSVLDYCVIEYGGAGTSNANVRIASFSPTVRNSTIRQSDGYGILITSAAFEPVLSANNYTATPLGAVQGSGTAEIRSRVSFWNAASGPAGAGPGTGEPVSSLVAFEPWSETVVSQPFHVLDALAHPATMNPNGGNVSVDAQLPESANWTLEVLNPAGMLVQTFTGTGSTVHQDWNGTGSTGNGVYTYRLLATSVATGQSASPLRGRIELNDAIPVAKIDSPANFQLLAGGGNIAVSGTATAANFASYTVARGFGELPTSFTPLQFSSTPVINGLLANWDTQDFSGSVPVHTLKLTVRNSAGDAATDTIVVRLFNIFNFSQFNSYFSPNGDGFLDDTLVRASFTMAANWTLRIRDASNTVIKTFTGSGTSMNVAWNGNDEAGSPMPEGNYTLQVEALEPGSGLTIISSPLVTTIDITPPIALISSPSDGAVIRTDAPIEVLGTADDLFLDIYFLSYTAGTSLPCSSGFWNDYVSVVDGPLGTLTTDNLANGTYTICLEVYDAAGNLTEADRVIELDRLQLSGISANPDVFDPVQGSAGIHYTLGLAADVTIQIYDALSHQRVRTLLASAPRLPGPHTEPWDGKDDVRAFLRPEAYYFTIMATDAAGRSGHFNVAATPVMGDIPFLSDNAVDSSGFDPFTNNLVKVQYAFGGHGRWTNIDVIRGGPGLVIRQLVINGLRLAGFHTEYWDGRRDDGTIYTGVFDIWYGGIEALPLHALIIQRPALFDPVSFQVQAYLIFPVYGEVSAITYTLNRPAAVTLEILDPNGNHFRTLASNAVQPAGPRVSEWDGKNDAGQWAAIQGAYTVRLTIVDPITGEVVQRVGATTVYR